MQLALNGATLGPCSLDDELAAASAAGFELVELRADKLGGAAELSAGLRAHGLRAWTINSIEGVGESTGLAPEARRLARLAAAAQCPYVVCVPGRAREGLEDALGEIAAVCRSEGVELAFEFMGFEWSAVRTLTEATRVADAAGGLAVVVDAWHWASGGGTLAELRAVDPERIAVVHFDDAPDLPLHTLGDADRLLPGEGVLPLEDFLRALSDGGFDGVVSVELFNPRLWQDGPGPAAARAREALEALCRGVPR
jgi:2-keto-myo-inositol isomerase